MMKKIVLLALFIGSVVMASAQGFPSTDSLRNYNTRFTTNSAITWFTNLRGQTLLRGIIDYIDTAKNGAIDTVYKTGDTLYVKTKKPQTYAIYIAPGGGGGGGTPGGSTTQVQFNNSGSFGGDAGLTYNSTTNELTTDSINLKNINVTGASGTDDIVVIRSANSSGYAGIDYKNTVRGSWPQFKLSNDLGYNMRHYVWGVDSGATSVIRSNAPGGLVLMTGHNGLGSSNNQNIYFETHAENGSDFAGQIWGQSKNWTIGSYFSADPGHQLYVDGTTKLKTTLEVGDEGHFYSWIKPAHYNNSASYLEGVGFKFYGITVSGTSPTFAIDSVGGLELPAYPQTRDDGYASGKALYMSGTGANGKVKYGNLFDATGGSQNPNQVLYWKSSPQVPTSSSGFTYNPATPALVTNGKIKLRDTLVIADRGFTYAYVKAGNYLDNANYVEGVNLGFITRNVSGLVTAAVMDSSGNFRIPSGYLFVNSTNSTANINMSAGTTSKALFNFGTGAAPSSPSAGDFWFDVADSSFKYRIGSNNLKWLYSKDQVVSTGLLLKPGAGTVADTIGVGGGTAGQVLVSNGSSSFATWSDLPSYAEGTYTASITNVTNVGTSSITTCHYQRRGDMVEVFGEITIDPTATGDTKLRISLPVASGITNSYDLSGQATTFDNVQSIRIYPELGEAVFRLNASVDASSHVYSFRFIYKYIAP